MKKLNFDEDVVTSFMETGAFDLLTILPHDKVEQYGIDYLHSQFEPNDLSAGEQGGLSSGTTTHVSGVLELLRTSVVTNLGELEHL